MGKRGYGEACAVAHALDLVGDRWSLLVVRELRIGPKRFSDLQLGLPNAGPTVLSQRLRELEENGVLRRRTLPPPAGSRVYELTPWGAELEPVFRALASWGVRSSRPREGLLSPDSVMLGLRTFFRPAGPGWTARYGIGLGRDRYRLSVVDGVLTELTRDDGSRPVDVTLLVPRQTTFQDLLDGTDTLTAVIDRGEVTLTGDRPLVQRLIDAGRTTA